MIGPSITEKQLFATLRGFLTTILPAGTPIIRAQVNRVAAPIGDFVLMSALRRERLETNIDATFDIKCTGQIDAGTLTVYAIEGGALAVGSVLFGPAPLIAGSTISGFLTGAGDTGTYAVSPVQTVPLGPLYAGITTSLMPTQATIQLDVFGPASAENAQRISTLLRDEFATHYFDGTGIDMQTLHADDPRQMPFIDAETQYEYRWIVEAVLQANIEVDTPMQFADEVVVAIPPPADGGDVDLLVDPDGDVMIDPDGDPIRVGGVTTTTVV